MGISTTTPSASSTTEGKVQLAGDIGGTAAAPTVTDLTIASEAQGDILYHSGSGWVRLGAGTSGQFLKTQGAAANPIWATGGGGQTLVTHVVAASGGTHTTLGAAITAAAAGDTIWVTPGTYVESAITDDVANLTIIGANPETCVISMGANTMALSGNYLHMENIKLSFTTGIINNSGTNHEIINCHYTKSGSGASALTSGANAIVRDCRFTSTQTDDVKQLQVCWATGCTIAGNQFTFNTTETTAGSAVVWINSTRGVVSGNYFTVNSSGTGYLAYVEGAGLEFSGNTLNGNTTTKLLYHQAGDIVGNTFTTGALGIWVNAACTIVGNKFTSVQDCIVIDQSPVTVTGNTFSGAGTTAGYTGIEIAANRDDATICGNTFSSSTFDVCILVSATSADNNVIVGNQFGSGNTTLITDGGVGTIIQGNANLPVTLNKNYVRMKNTSGAQIDAGDIVVRKAVAAGDEVTTTTTGGDPTVFGMAAETIANNAYGIIQVEGKTTALKVDGTTDIAIGDYIAPFTTAKIGRKGVVGTTIQTGDTVIAVALEAYATNDSSGVIDAILIPPRII